MNQDEMMLTTYVGVMPAEKKGKRRTSRPSDVPTKILPHTELVSSHLYCPHSKCASVNKGGWTERSMRQSKYKVVGNNLITWWWCPNCQRSSMGFSYPITPKKVEQPEARYADVFTRA